MYTHHFARARRRVLLATLFLLAGLLAGCEALTPGSNGNTVDEPSVPTPFQALVPDPTSTQTSVPPSPSPLPTASPTVGQQATMTAPAATPVPPSATPTASALPTVDGTPREGQELVDALRGGGYVLYFRHTATDSSQGDEQAGEEWWTSCDAQAMRQLSEEGQAQARAIGEALRALEIPVGEVWASPYCRTMETGRLMDVGPVAATDDLMNMLAADLAGGQAAVTARAQQRLAASPSPGTNTVLVAHGNIFQAAAEMSLAEGEAAILAPDGAAFALVARVLPEEWAELAAQYQGDGAAETCEATAPDMLGPFYQPNAPVRARVGQGHVLQGVVRSAPDCSPIPEARLEFWLAGPNGQYDDDHRATMFAGPDGAYRFESNPPPPYGGRPAHIHVRVTARGHEVLVTQYYPGTGQTEGTFDLVLVPQPGAASSANGEVAPEPVVVEYPVPSGSRPHDVAPAVDGGVWYTAQGSGELGFLDPTTGETRHVALGRGSSPHGVIVGPDGAPWITDSGLNALVRVDPATEEVQLFPLPEGSGNANLNTAAFDGNGVLWFTGQAGVYGRLDPATGEVEVFDAPRGRGPYGIAATPEGAIYYASLAGSHIARVDLQTGEAEVLEPPTTGQGARRVWSDSAGRVWVSEWNAGQLGMYDPAGDIWREWTLPGDRPQPYAVYVDDQDMVWLSDFGANALVRFDPAREEFEQFVLPSSGAAVRQILGRPGEVWAAESGVDKLVVLRTR